MFRHVVSPATSAACSSAMVVSTNCGAGPGSALTTEPVLVVGAAVVMAGASDSLLQAASAAIPNAHAILSRLVFCTVFNFNTRFQPFANDVPYLKIKRQPKGCLFSKNRTINAVCILTVRLIRVPIDFLFQLEATGAGQNARQGMVALVAGVFIDARRGAHWHLTGPGLGV